MRLTENEWVEIDRICQLNDSGHKPLSIHVEFLIKCLNKFRPDFGKEIKRKPRKRLCQICFGAGYSTIGRFSGKCVACDGTGRNNI